MRNATHEFHLSKPQMGVHKAEREGGVAIGLCLNEWNLMIVPIDRHRRAERQARNWKFLEPFGRRGLAEQRREQRTAGQLVQHD